MKYLIIFDSAFGNTQKIARVIAKTLDANVINVNDVEETDIELADFIMVGSPINGWMPLPSINKFLNSLEPNSLANKKITSFDTRVKLFIHGDAKEKISKILQKVGGELAIEPKAFYVKGSEGPLYDKEIDSATEWAKEISKINK